MKHIDVRVELCFDFNDEAQPNIDTVLGNLVQYFQNANIPDLKELTVNKLDYVFVKGITDVGVPDN